MKTKFSLACIACSLLVLSTFSQSESFTKKDAVVLKCSDKIAKFEKIKVWSGSEQYLIDLAGSAPDAILINESDEWKKTFPTFKQYFIADFNVSAKKPSEIILQEAGAFRRIKIKIPPHLDVQKTLSELLFKGTLDVFRSSSYFDKLLTDAAKQTFTNGPLARLSLEKQKEILKWSGLNPGAFQMSKFKDKEYLSIETSQDVVFNTIQVNQAERVARQVEFSLKQLRELRKITGTIGGADGIGARASIASRDFVRHDDEKVEKFEMYIPVEDFEKFIAADITNQELADRSIILLDESRMKVNLAEFSH